jgi:hypothetical protein
VGFSQLLPIIVIQVDTMLRQASIYPDQPISLHVNLCGLQRLCGLCYHCHEQIRIFRISSQRKLAISQGRIKVMIAVLPVVSGGQDDPIAP